MSRFRITHELLFPHEDETLGVPCSVIVEAGNIRDALVKASDLPFPVLMADVNKDEE